MGNHVLPGVVNTEQNRSHDRTDEKNSSSGGSENPTFNRRTCLQLAGAVVVSTAGCVSNGDLTEAAGSGSAGAAPVGYGGMPALLRYLPSGRLSTESEGGSINTPSGTAVRLDTDDRTASRLSSGADWYAFDTTDVSDLTIKYDRADPRGVSGFALYDAEGTLVDQAYVAGDKPVYLLASPRDGTHYLQVSNVFEGTGDYALSLSTDATTTAEQSPYEGTVSSLPGRVQAQNFDVGGEGVAYHDTSEENKYDTSYRDSSVDVRETKDESGAYNIGYFEEGEWLEYTVDPSPGTYELRVRVASARSGRQLAVSLGGQQLATIDVPETGGWSTWETVTVSDVSVESGEKQILRLEALNSGIDFNWVEFAATTNTSTPTDTAAPTDDFGDDGYGEDGYGGMS